MYKIRHDLYRALFYTIFALHIIMGRGKTF